MIPPPMQRALDISREAPQYVSPNPLVGAVIVDSSGAIAGEGTSQPAPDWTHAEVMALSQAGEKARGGTMYTTLEPCCHEGKTLACTDAIIAVGISEVHYALRDPDPKVDGSGQDALEAAGVSTVAGEGEDEARRILEAFVKHRTTGLPFVIAKYAASLDGKIAAASGDSRWVSGPETREWAHSRLRTRIDAILVGSSTIVIDDPQLIARPGGQPAERTPLRVIVDTRGRTPPMAQALSGGVPALIATGPDAPAGWRSAIEATGAEVLALPLDGEHVDLRALLEELGRRDIVNLLVEGGGGILGAFFDSGLVDKLHAIIAPVIVGAADAPGPVAGTGAYRMADALRLRDVIIERLGEDFLFTAYPDYSERA
ncbi:MAG TPA: bifunctional diaminohydroxyphosphoribosylaminopyrimidine deaminase/5-amino-6-(5-phosphoribosylamino)uracil reductase RibD [Dehalococcoidia bacterium]|nr:bifunctional diaminohydroxyphosphoribosylaminopyrimidine deaminase/5-amino-6-(5-phosphoribosylamino)uracil reductase RibD [Dehalococcoidia bacterium]